MGDLINSRDSSLKMYLHLLIIALIGFLAYSNTFHAPFVFDDLYHIKNNQTIKDLHSFLFQPDSRQQYNSHRFIGYLSFALNYHFGGDDVKGFHLTNLFIHIVNAFLVYFLVKLTFKTPVMRQEGSLSGHPTQGSTLMALFVALLFVSHPVQTGAVTYIYQRLASLAALFYLLSVLLYVKGRLSTHTSEVGKKFTIRNSGLTASVGWYLLSIAFALLAMKTKEMAFTLPLVILLYEATFFKALLKKKLLLFLPVVLTTLTIAPLGLLAVDKPLGEILSQLDQATRAETDMPRWDYLMTQMRVIITYIRLIFFPINQNVDYDYPIYRSFFTPPVFLSFALLISLFGLGVYLLHKAQKQGSLQGTEQKPYVSYYRLAGFGILWFFITLSIESSIIPIDDVIFEHRLYLPLAGFLMALTAGLLIAAIKFKKVKFITPIFVAITLALSTTTYFRNTVWADGESLWEDAARKSPNWDRPHNNLGTVYYDQGRLDEAIREFQTALKLNYDYADAHNNLGVVYERQGRLDEATKEYAASVMLKPDNADMRNNLGSSYERLGRFDLAVKEYEAALRIDPGHAGALNNLEGLNNRIGSK